MNDVEHTAWYLEPNSLALIGSADDIAVTAILDWPTEDNEAAERLYLRTVGHDCTAGLGFSTQRSPVPDMYMYYDAFDACSPVNELAGTIADCTPSYKKSGVQPPLEGVYRGRVVMFACPTTISFVTFVPSSFRETVTATVDPKYTKTRLQHELYFFLSQQADARVVLTVDSSYHQHRPRTRPCSTKTQ